jgi:DNA-binding MarR family transcriptional regulator
MDETKIKEAFQKVKEDISKTVAKVDALAEQINMLNRTLTQTDTPTDRQTQAQNLQTDNQTLQTERLSQESKIPLNALKSANSNISIGNDGVQTDKQTDRQTNRQESFVISKDPSIETVPKFALNTTSQDPLMKIDKVTEIISSLDSLKKDLRRQFKQLTSQEMLVFSTIYQLTDRSINVDYPTLSKKIDLSESSIRDYVQKLIKKGIPLEKTKENNKRVVLSISPQFKRIASLETLASLRNL